jgi:hypothetical protein
MTITLFSIAATPSRPPGLALVCAEARYASVLYDGASRLDRRFGTTLIWRQALTNLRGGLGSPALQPASPFVRLLLPQSGAAVRYVLSQDIELPALDAAQALDAELRRHAAAVERAP